MTSPVDALEGLLAVMARLRSANGCPWDREQSFATVAPYTLEEAYEVVDAIERNDRDALRDELGDLLFQVVFHARMAEELGWFEFRDVARGVRDKLIRRHPHVFAEPRAETAASQSVRWEELKARERAEIATAQGSDTSALAGVPKALPALLRAAKLARRAARVGFDWPDAAAVREKVVEELRELDAELDSQAGDRDGTNTRVAEELGDLLFAVVNWSRHFEVDAEDALRAANAKFEHRFRRMEELARTRGLALQDLSANQWDELWGEAKVGDRLPPSAFRPEKND
jgi:nucleoside triphosphate diphosphatase